VNGEKNLKQQRNEQEKLRKKKFIECFEAREEDNMIEGHLPKESRVAKILIGRITKIMIIVVLGMLLVLPCFSADLYWKEKDPCDFDIDYLVSMYEGGHWSKPRYLDYHIFLHEKYKNSITPMIACKFADHIEWRVESFSDFRGDEMLICSYTLENSEQVLMQVILSERDKKIYEASLGIARTTFILCLLLFGS
jgi:hypothetical protein